MERLRIQLRSVFYNEGGVWFSHCLEMDVLGHGKSKSLAFRMMLDAICTQVANSIAADNRANIFMPADARYFEMYSAGRDVADGELVVEVKRARQSFDRVDIQDVETREYDGIFAMA